MTRAKVCGITNAADRDVAVAAGADAVGFVVDVRVDTPREIGVDAAARLAESTPPFVTTVAVTMPDGPRDVERLVAATGVDAVQIHGAFDPADLSAVDAPVALVKAVESDVTEAERYDDAVDALLVDSMTEDGGGGTGRTHDWAATRRVVESVSSPVILAGGLTPENVREAVDTVDPYAVDVATGVEASGGRKDHDAVRGFVRAATRPEVEAR
jgi:phosphoribosylanthranilate isomerase